LEVILVYLILKSLLFLMV